MIKRIFNKLLESRPAFSPLKTEPFKRELACEPKEEVVKEPTPSENFTLGYNSEALQVKAFFGTDYSAHTKLLQSGEFEISEDGRVKLPSDSHLNEADALVEQRTLALQAQKALDWAKTVSSEVDYRLDGSEYDQDPRPGHTVASGVDEYWFIRKAELPYLQHQTYSVQSGPGGTRLFEDSYGKRPELFLAVHEEEQLKTLQMASDKGGNQSLHLVWNKETTSIKAEIRQDESYAEKEVKSRTKASYDSHDLPYPAREERDTFRQDFLVSDRIRSHGGGHHLTVKASGRFPNDQSYPSSFQDQKTGKTYSKTTYRKLDGTYLYVENR